MHCHYVRSDLYEVLDLYELSGTCEISENSGIPCHCTACQYSASNSSICAETVKNAGAGPIIGGVVGGVVALAALLGVIFIIIKRKPKRNSSKQLKFESHALGRNAFQTDSSWTPDSPWTTDDKVDIEIILTGAHLRHGISLEHIALY